jgi:chromosomal replication initiator protein
MQEVKAVSFPHFRLLSGSHLPAQEPGLHENHDGSSIERSGIRSGCPHKESPMTAVAEVMEDRVLAAPFAGTRMDAGPDATAWALPDGPPGLQVAMSEEPRAAESGARPATEDPLQRISDDLRTRIGKERFEMWFERKSRFSLAGNALLVDAPNAFAARWIGSKFRDELHAAVLEAVGHSMEVIVRIDEAAATAGMESEAGPQMLPSAPHAPGRLPTAAGAPQEPAINSKYTLEEFVIGPSNQLAYHAACRVAQEPGQQFNPLFIHGPCGLGKTHLLQGICQRFARLHPGKKWLYLTGEHFTNEFLEALRTRKTAALRRRLRQADLLVIDDVHFLANKKATQEEFLHTFNQVDASGRQIVLASDCAPRQIHALSEQLSSRFVSGMVLRVDSPDLPTRLEILRRRVLRYGWNISDSVLMHIAQSATSSVRELEGLLLQVVAGISLINSGSPEAGAVLASIRERTLMRGPVAMERIVEAVGEYLAVPASAILGSGREKIVSAARALVMYLARQHTGMSYPEIGRALGNKNHSTVIAACQRIEAMVSASELLCWCTPTGPRHQAVCDILRELETAIRRTR